MDDPIDEEFDRLIEMFNPNGFIPMDVCYITNDLPDIMVETLYQHTEHGVAELRTRLGMTDSCAQVIRPTNNPSCPFVRLYLDGSGPNVPTNYQLQTFCHAAGITQVNQRCVAALVIGVTSNDALESFVSIPISFYTRPLDELVALEFQLHQRCDCCFKNRKKCDKVVPCAYCLDSCKKPRLCMPRPSERTFRVSSLVQEVSSNVCPHSDIPKYLVHHQSAKVGGYMLMNVDAGFLTRRIDALPLRPMLLGMDRSSLPPTLSRYLHESPMTKVEWMSGCEYVVDMTNYYSQLVIDKEEIGTISIKLKAPAKLVDTCNLNSNRLAYDTWVLSVENPGCVCRAGGACLWKNGHLQWAEINVVSLVYNRSDVVSVTWLKDLVQQ